jgi:predicted ArsR family transcriptional regulator
VALKRVGDATADELAITLAISTRAVRQHLHALASYGLVVASPDRGHPGRPADRYRPTALSETVFSTAESNLSVELLEHIESEDPDLVSRVFEKRRRRMVRDTEDELVAMTHGQRVTALTDILDSKGYLADCEDEGDDSFQINLHNCPMWAVATHYPQACASELEFLRDLLPGAIVDRTTHKAAGAHTCSYQVRWPDDIDHDGLVDPQSKRAGS